MVAVMMAYPAISAAVWVWMAALSLVGACAWLMSVAKTKTQRMVVFVAAAVLTAILITATQAKADDFACPTCGCAWWWC